MLLDPSNARSGSWFRTISQPSSFRPDLEGRSGDLQPLRFIGRAAEKGSS
jgi:hypothetical protein